MILTSIVDPDGTSARDAEGTNRADGLLTLLIDEVAGEPYDPTKAGLRHRVGMMTQASFDAGLARIDEP